MLVLNQISVQLDWQLLSVVLPFVMVIVVVALGEVLLRRRRKRVESREVEVEIPKAQMPQSKEPLNESFDEDSEQGRLEELRAELDNVSALYSSGKMNREEFSDRIRKVEDELLTFKPSSPQVERPKIEEPSKRVCVHCNEEIPLEAVYCDRCGRYLGATSKVSS